MRIKQLTKTIRLSKGRFIRIKVTANIVKNKQGERQIKIIPKVILSGNPFFKSAQADKAIILNYNKETEKIYVYYKLDCNKTYTQINDILISEGEELGNYINTVLKMFIEKLSNEFQGVDSMYKIFQNIKYEVINTETYCDTESDYGCVTRTYTMTKLVRFYNENENVLVEFNTHGNINTDGTVEYWYSIVKKGELYFSEENQKWVKYNMGADIFDDSKDIYYNLTEFEQQVYQALLNNKIDIFDKSEIIDANEDNGDKELEGNLEIERLYKYFN